MRERAASAAVSQTPTRVSVLIARVPEVRPFVIAEKAYLVETQRFDPSKSTVYWVAVIQNQNEHFYGKFPTITITARNADGTVAGTQDQVLNDLPPGTRAAFASLLQVTGTPTSVEFSTGKVQWSLVSTKPALFEPFGSDRVTLIPDRTQGYVVTGEVLNPYLRDVESLAVTVLLRDDQGKLVLGRTTFVSGIAAGGSRPFSISVPRGERVAAGVEIISVPWGSTDWNRLAQP